MSLLNVLRAPLAAALVVIATLATTAPAPALAQASAPAADAAGIKARRNSPQVIWELVRWCRHHSGLKSRIVMRIPLKA